MESWLLWNVFCVVILLGRFIAADQRFPPRKMVLGMEGFGIIAWFFWTIFCGAVLLARFRAKDAIESPSPMFPLYLLFSAGFGASIIIQQVMKLALRTSEWTGLDWLLFLWYLAWSPASLVATYLAPKRFCFFPVAFVIANAVFGALGWLLVDDYSKSGEQSINVFGHFFLIVIGCVLVIGSVGSFRQSNRKESHN